MNTRMSALLAATLMTAALAGPALAEGPESVRPMQAVLHDFQGTPVLAYYTQAAGRCEAVVMLGSEPGPRLRLSLAALDTSVVESPDGQALTLTCGAGAARMTVERAPMAQTTASR